MAGCCRFPEHGNDVVKGDVVRAIRQERIIRAVEGLGSRERVALDAGDLHDAGNGIAGQPQVVLEAHLRGILDLPHGAAEKLCGRGRGHRTCDTDLSLAADLGPGNGGVVLDQVADQAGGRKRAEDRIVEQPVISWT